MPTDHIITLTLPSGHKESLTREQALSIAGTLRAKCGAGRPRATAECRHCGLVVSARGRRIHEPQCADNPRNQTEEEK